MNKVILNGADLTIEDVVRVAREGYEVEVCEESRNQIEQVRKYMEDNWMREDAPAVYGFNTGLGKLKDFKVSLEDSDMHQYKTVLSHCGGVGDPAPEDVVRATMVVRVNAFCQGVSGLRLCVVDRLLDMLNKGVHPVVPWQGSVGACGDLAPMAHICSVLIGLEPAEAFYKGQRMPAREALKAAGMEPDFKLRAKDCLALMNGTTMFAGMAALNYYDAELLLKEAEITTALSLEAVRGEMRAFDERIHKVRRQVGQMKSAANVRRLVEGSQRVTEDARKVHLEYDIMHPKYQERVQDFYSLRCMPQVQGACRDNFAFAKETLTREINAATDNPLIFPTADGKDMEFLSGGNFHGEPIGFAMDILALSMAELSNISERRVFNMCDQTLSYGLPPMLAGEPVGLNYGYTIIGCSAAALASENKTLAFPATADNVPTKANQEDHVSMAPWACRKARLIIENLKKILGIEYLLACRAIFITQEQLGQFKLGKGTQVAYDALGTRMTFTKEDSYMGTQSKAALSFLQDGELLGIVEKVVGEL